MFRRLYEASSSLINMFLVVYCLSMLYYCYPLYLSVCSSQVTGPIVQWFCLCQHVQIGSGAHSAPCMVIGPACNNSGQSAKHSAASGAEVKDMSAPFILILRFTHLFRMACIFCYCETSPVTLPEERVYKSSKTKCLG